MPADGVERLDEEAHTYLARSAAVHGRKPALTFRGTTWTYRELQTEAGAISSALGTLSLEPGDRVVLWAHNSAAWVAALFSILQRGGIVVPLHPTASRQRVRSILRDCRPSVVVMGQSQFADHGASLAVVAPPIVELSDEGPADPTRPLFRVPEAAKVSRKTEPAGAEAGEGIALILYTSGSSREPRGVICPHRQIAFVRDAIQRCLEYRAEDTVYCGLPLSFDYGLYQVFLCAAVGAHLVLETSFRQPLEIPRRVLAHGITIFPAVPSLLTVLLRSGLLARIGLPRLRMITSTGEVLPTAHVREIRLQQPGVSVVPMYGLTECKRVSIMPRGALGQKEGSVGLPLAGTLVRVVDAQGRDVASGEVGELVVSGPHLTEGYWNAPAETADRFRLDPQTGRRVLFTGDQFRRDSDGFLYFVARNENLVKLRGHRIGLQEIEMTLAELDGVAETAVIDRTDGSGEDVIAVVSTARGARLEVADVIRHCRAILPGEACPHHVVLSSDPLPRTPNGKLDREELKKAWWQATDESVQVPPQAERGFALAGDG